MSFLFRSRGAFGRIREHEAGGSDVQKRQDCETHVHLIDANSGPAAWTVEKQLHYVCGAVTASSTTTPHTSPKRIAGRLGVSSCRRNYPGKAVTNRRTGDPSVRSNAAPDFVVLRIGQPTSLLISRPPVENKHGLGAYLSPSSAGGGDRTHTARRPRYFQSERLPSSRHARILKSRGLRAVWVRSPPPGTQSNKRDMRRGQCLFSTGGHEIRSLLG